MRVVVLIALGLLASLVTTATAPSALASEPHALNGLELRHVLTGRRVVLVEAGPNGFLHACNLRAAI
jgi:hypothetical protein